MPIREGGVSHKNRVTLRILRVISRKRMGDDEQSLQGGDGEVAGQPAGEEVAYVDPWVGQYLADYYIIRRLGEGGMGIVYLARHQSLDRLAAVKFLGAHMVDDKGYIERFLNEARGAAKLNHPNIVAVYDAGSMGENIYYFIMEYIEGQDLGTLLRERHIFPVPEAVGYIRQAAVALGYAHKKRIIHRDIKPDNLMLTHEGTIKVGDLGLAKWMSDDGSGGMTQSGVVMGTPFYISPEQVRGSRDVDWRSDIYSLGATLHHMVTGRIPYEGTSPAVIMAMHLNSPVPEPNRANPSLDADVCAIIRKMMAKNVEDRFQTMEDVDAALAEYQAGKMRSAQFAPGVVSPLPAQPPTEPQRLPTEPPERIRLPIMVQSEPGAPVKIATIIGVSIIAAAVILGLFLSSVLKFKAGETAGAAQPRTASETTQPRANVAVDGKPIEIKLPEVVPAVPPQPTAANAEVAAQNPEPPPSRPPPDVPPRPTPAIEQASQPPQNEGLFEMARTQTPPAEVQPFVGSPSSDMHGQPSGPPEMVIIMADGTEHVLPEKMQELLRSPDRIKRAFYAQPFNAAEPGVLPKGVECMLVEPGGRSKPIIVGPAGFKSQKPFCEANWGFEKDDNDLGRPCLKLRHETEVNQWILGIKFNLPSPVRGKKFWVTYTLRAGNPSPRIELATEPESGFLPKLQLSDRWKTYIVPMPLLARSELRSILIGMQGTGELQIAEVRVEPIPEAMKFLSEKFQSGQGPQTPTGSGNSTFGKRRR